MPVSGGKLLKHDTSSTDSIFEVDFLNGKYRTIASALMFPFSVIVR